MESYPEAAYYKFSIYPEEVSVTSPYVSERVEGTSFAISKPLQKGTYRWQVEAYNAQIRSSQPAAVTLNLQSLMVRIIVSGSRVSTTTTSKVPHGQL